MFSNLPTEFKISNTFPLVRFEMTAFPAKSCALTPSPAVIRSLFCNKHNSGSDGSSYTCFVFPSIIKRPNV